MTGNALSNVINDGTYVIIFLNIRLASGGNPDPASSILVP